MAKQRQPSSQLSNERFGSSPVAGLLFCFFIEALKYPILLLRKGGRVV
jgi:hypothetical protein